MKKIMAVAAVAMGLSVISAPTISAPDPFTAPDAKTMKTWPKAQYKVPGRLEGTTGFIHEDEAPKKSNKSYPAWFRGNGKNGAADESALYWYTELIAPKAYKPTKNMTAENLYCGTLFLAPGATYPAHNHPASEFYFLYEGSGKWCIDDECQKIRPGHLMYHRPFAAHGWQNTGKVPMKLLYCWWKEEGDKVNVMNYGARWINPEKFTGPKDTVPYAVPFPEVRKAK